MFGFTFETIYNKSSSVSGVSLLGSGDEAGIKKTNCGGTGGV